MTANVTNADADADADAGLRHNASSMDLPAPSPGWVVAGGGVHDPRPAGMCSRCGSDALVGGRPSTSGWLAYIFCPKTGAS
ncbi:hypothetical protein [Frankia sp. Cas4]|uniref:hypothetical protein n=1 Tax=Frankia sp. Cas4 TaxID=3073927 RepID=UPI002AD4DE48|nr:hypothetical protein [Frankia sp. Cas4]